MELSCPQPGTRKLGVTLKAEPAAQLALLDLQRADSALAQLAHQRKTLPILAEIAELESKRQDLGDSLGQRQTDAEDLTREQKKADRDVEQVKTRKAKDAERLNSGQVSDPKQVQSIQHEIESLTRRISDLEDVELEVMERLEAATTDVSDLEGQIASLDADLKAKTDERDRAFAALDEKRAAHQAERDESAAGVPDDLMALYDKLAVQFSGVAVGELKQGRCEGCRLDVGAAEMRKLKGTPTDEVARCEECNRILVRTAESGL